MLFLYERIQNLVSLLLLVSVLDGARPGFHSTGNLEWRDCGDGDTWVNINHFDLGPTPIKFPSNVTLSLDGTLSHFIEHDAFTIDVLVERDLLGTYTHIPCQHNVGTCHYADACNLLHDYEKSKTCSAILKAMRLPCSCPFHPVKFHLPPTKFLTDLSDGWKCVGPFMFSCTIDPNNPWRNFKIIFGGNVHVKITMNDKKTQEERGCFETYFTIDRF